MSSSLSANWPGENCDRSTGGTLGSDSDACAPKAHAMKSRGIICFIVYSSGIRFGTISSYSRQLECSRLLFLQLLDIIRHAVGHSNLRFSEECARKRHSIVELGRALQKLRPIKERDWTVLS